MSYPEAKYMPLTSSEFPKLVLTREDYIYLVPRLPHIASYRTVFADMELWLHANEKRRPKARWRVFLLNWYRRQNKYNAARKRSKLQSAAQGARVAESRKAKADSDAAVAQLGPVLAKMMSGMSVRSEAVNPNEKYRCRCGQVHSPNYKCEAQQ